MGPARQRADLRAGLGRIGRLGEDGPVQVQYLITTKNHRLALDRADAAGFHLGQCVGKIARSGALGFEPRAECVFVDPGRPDLGRKTRAAQERRADTR